MRFSKTRFLAGAVVVAVGFSLAVAPTATAATKTLTVWTDEQRGPTMKALLVGKNPVPGFKIEVKTFSNLSALDTAWASATAASGPDLMISNAGLAASGGKSGKLVPLTLPASVKRQFGEKAFQALSYKGKLYGVPLDVDTTALFYNTALFGKTAPTTFGQMVDWFKANKTSKGLTAGLCVPDSAWGSLPVITALGGSAWDYTKGGDPIPNKTSFNSAAFKANVSKFLLNADGSSNGFFSLSDCAADFHAGKIPFMNTGVWRVGDMEKAKISYGVARVPGVAKGSFGSPWAGYQAAYVTSFASSRGAKAAALRFAVQFMANSTTQAQLSAAGGRPPANLNAAKLMTDPVTRGIALAGSGGRLQLSVLLDDKTAGSNWYDIVQAAFDDILKNGKPVGATLDTAAEKLTKNFINGSAGL